MFQAEGSEGTEAWGAHEGQKSARRECGVGGRVKGEVGRGQKMQSLRSVETPWLDPEGNRGGE